jgi:hypothetical protein
MNGTLRSGYGDVLMFVRTTNHLSEFYLKARWSTCERAELFDQPRCHSGYLALRHKAT